LSWAVVAHRHRPVELLETEMCRLLLKLSSLAVDRVEKLAVRRVSLAGLAAVKGVTGKTVTWDAVMVR
jgi:hypothetical protein